MLKLVLSPIVDLLCEQEINHIAACRGIEIPTKHMGCKAHYY